MTCFFFHSLKGSYGFPGKKGERGDDGYQVRFYTTLFEFEIKDNEMNIS